MSLSAAEIALLVREVKEGLCPGKVDQIYQISPTDTSWKIRTAGGTRHLLISAHPTRSRLHLLRQPPTPPPSPSGFARSLRGRLSSGTLVDIEQVEGDRMVRLTFERGGERLTLIAEIMGRGSHLLLVDERGKILACLRPYRGRSRTLVPGVRYFPPSPPAQPRPSEVRPFFDGEGGPSRLAEAYYREREAEDQLTERVAVLRKGLGRAKRRAASAEGKIRASLEETKDAARFRRMGELMKGSLATIRKGMREALLGDPMAPEGPKVRIPLDPARTPVENMSALFRKARKLKRGRGELEKRLRRAEANLQEVRDALSSLASAGDTESIGRIEEEARRKGWLPRVTPPKGKAAPRRGHRRFLSRDGLEIWVGRTDRENEEMTFRLSRGEDLFLHVDGRPGSHVIVRRPRGSEVPQETLLDAAELAAHFSAARDQQKVQVVYTPRKHVRRGKRGRAGQVTISRERTILLRRDPDRLGRLLRSVVTQEEVQG